jgi:hypothetical protein
MMMIFLGSLGLYFNSSLYADKEGDIVNDSYYVMQEGKVVVAHELKGALIRNPTLLV